MEVIVASIEMSAGASGCKEREARYELHNSSALVAQSILMIKKRTL